MTFTLESTMAFSFVWSRPLPLLALRARALCASVSVLPPKTNFKYSWLRSSVVLAKYNVREALRVLSP